MRRDSGCPTTVLVLATVIGSLGCTVTRQGTISSREAGRTIHITVELRGESAEITGRDAASGERFSGVLLVDEERRRSPQRPELVPPPIGGGGGAGPGAGPAPVRGSSTLYLAGTISGDRGTRLRCSVEVKQRLRLSGSGVCRPPDLESGPAYTVLF